MARRYKRYRKQSDDTASQLAVLILISVGALVWKLQNENSEMLPYLIVVTTVLVLAVGCLVLWKYGQSQRKLRALDIAAIDTMDPLEFEVYVAKLLKSKGFMSIKLTERYDYGVDIVAERNNVRWGVQVKRHSNLVKAEAVRQVYTALVRYRCDRAMVATNNWYSRPAKALAADNNCVLIDRDGLTNWIVEFQNN